MKKSNRKSNIKSNKKSNSKQNRAKNGESNRKYNKYRMIMNRANKALSKVFIEIYSGESLEETKILSNTLIEKLKTLFYDYKKKNYFIEKFNCIDFEELKKKIDCIDYLLNLTFINFLKLAEFPFEDTEPKELEDSPVSINKIKEILKKVLKKDEQKITEFKNNEIFLDKLKGRNTNKDKKNVPTNNNYFKREIDNRNYKSYNNLLNLNCEKIIKNIIKDKEVDEQKSTNYNHVNFNQNNKDNFNVENNIPENYLKKKTKRDSEEEELKNNNVKNEILLEKKESKIYSILDGGQLYNNIALDISFHSQNLRNDSDNIDINKEYNFNVIEFKDIGVCSEKEKNEEIFNNSTKSSTYNFFNENKMCPDLFF